MPCFTPIVGYKARKAGPDGKRAVVFSPHDGFRDLEVRLPCGKCVGCRLERSRQWAVRIMHEAGSCSDSWFLTLTYEDAHLPTGGSLRKSDLQKFWKRLRKAVAPERVRYFACGEYGTVSERPHYHACVFGPEFADRSRWARRKEHTAFRSQTIEDAWTLGHSELGTLSFESAAYVARYCVKGSLGRKPPAVVDHFTGELAEREPEFAVMSRRPGIGHSWIEKYGGEVYAGGSVIMRGHEMKPPRYYDEKFAEIDSEAVEAAKLKREELRDPRNETEERLAVREKCTLARLHLKERKEL